MTRVTRIESTVAPLPINDIDTDQIIPARYLKITDKSGLAEGLFSNWRDTPEFTLNQPQYKGARVLLAGDNFGCGSSREHAPWALLEGGWEAVISTSFADIFRNNALKNGLLVVEVEEAIWSQLLADVERDPSLKVVIDLEQQTLSMPDGGQVAFTVDPFARHCLLNGIDQFGYLLEQLPEIEAWEGERSPRVDSR